MAVQLPSNQPPASSIEAGFPADIPFIHDLGLRNLPAALGCSEVSLDPEDRHCNSFFVIHGGVVMSMLDVGMAMAARSAKQPELMAAAARALASGEPAPRALDGFVTIEMKTSFLRPAKGAVRALGKCLHITATMAFCEAELVDAQGVVLAKSSGTFKAVLRRAMPAGLDA
jgi:acyl-coenzyme A thioesterase PaaI-like protein